MVGNRDVEDVLGPWYVFNLSTHIGTLELPGYVSHDVHGVGSSHSNADGPQPPPIGRVGVCANQHDSRVGIVFQDDLSR